ncbi:hypothetical protein IYY11_11610 [Methylocystis sp. H62]|uniref:hypothetical protein n=1 Tax=Methylocystis sp. H62 TaxID=2785789 RepID=UPI0018C22B6E|nr:hypothetical protein [Methylocystis sp. H62]MBG0794019.1 hypothetical protein [Methylocystis sp. H62]
MDELFELDGHCHARWPILHRPAAEDSPHFGFVAQRLALGEDPLLGAREACLEVEILHMGNLDINVRSEARFEGFGL